MEVLFLVIFSLAVLLLGQMVKHQRGNRSNSVTRRGNTSGRTKPVENDRPTAPEPRKLTPLAQEKVVFGRAYVTDGDGLRIKGEEIRLFGIDAPEFKHPYGKKSKLALIQLCKGQEVMGIAAETDHYGRLVARCFLSDGRDLAAEMVKQGLALDWPKFSGGMYGDFETPDARKKLWLADARQKGRMDVWAKFEAQQRAPAGHTQS